MPKFVLRRNHMLHSILGHSIRFEAGVETEVPAILIPEVVAIGGECVDGPVDVLPEEVKAQIPLVGEDRQAVLFAAYETIVNKNDPADFTGAGVPRVKVVERLSGITVDTKENVTMWQKYRENLAG